MNRRLIIDGNNLLHLMHAYSTGRPVGRLHLAGMIDRYVKSTSRQATLVFDGPRPRGGIAKQFDALHIEILFSGPVTADDIILQIVERLPDPTGATVVSSDHAVRDGARRRKVEVVGSEEFGGVLLASTSPPRASPTKPIPAPKPVSEEEKPQAAGKEEVDRWLREMWEGEDDLPPDWQIG